MYKGSVFPSAHPPPNSHTLSFTLDDQLLACRRFFNVSLLAIAAATMPKDSEPRVRCAQGVPYHRQNKQRKSNTRKHKDHVRGTHSVGGDCTSGLQSSLCRDAHILPADDKSFRLADHCKASLVSTLARSPGCAASVAVDTVAHVTGTPESVTQDIHATTGPTSLRSSEAPTIPASPNPSEASIVAHRLDNSVPVLTSLCARLEEFEFEFEDVIQIDGDQCQVRWADSIIRDSDLCKRHLHGKLLLEYAASSVPLGCGVSKVMWELTWEPIDILRGYKDIVQRESQFEYGDVIDEQGGRSLVQWESSVIHESTVQTLGDHALINQVQSLSYPSVHGYTVVARKPMWVPSHIMEAYGGTC